MNVKQIGHVPPQATPPKSDLELAQSLNQESKWFRDEAQRLLVNSRENLEKSERFTDLSMSNLRQLVFAMSSLLPRPIQVDIDFSLDDADSKLKELADDIETTVKQRELFDIVHAINVLAMANTDVIHITTDFAAHINWFHVRVRPTTTDYLDKNRPEDHLLREYVDMGEEEVLEKLLLIESKITELIINAREEAETTEEVEA